MSEPASTPPPTPGGLDRTTGAERSPRPGGGVPARIGRYVVSEVLGEGGFGRVYRGFDPKANRAVALKVPLAHALTPGLRERFLREARAAAAIQHPNVCPIYDVETDGDLPYLVMRFVPGGTLAGVLDQRQKPFATRSAVAIVRKIALGVAAAHARNVLHRDLKPANVLWDEENRDVLVTDFGLARIAGAAQLSQTGEILGTPAYMSPEQARAKQGEVGPLTDVYSLGVILYRLVTGVVPFDGSVMEILAQAQFDEPRPPSAVRGRPDPRLDGLCARAMAKKPEDRYPSARAFAEALADYLRETSPGEAEPPLSASAGGTGEVRPVAPPPDRSRSGGVPVPLRGEGGSESRRRTATYPPGGHPPDQPDGSGSETGRRSATRPIPWPVRPPRPEPELLPEPQRPNLLLPALGIGFAAFFSVIVVVAAFLLKNPNRENDPAPVPPAPPGPVAKTEVPPPLVPPGTGGTTNPGAGGSTNPGAGDQSPTPPPVSTPPVSTPEPPLTPGGPFAVIVGAGDYQDQTIFPRPTADADAKALYDLVTDPRYLGVPAGRAKLFLSAPDAKRNARVATRDGVVKAVEAAAEFTGKGDLLVLAFFGRGASAGDKTVYFTPGTRFRDRAKTGLVFGTHLAPAFEKVRGQNVLFLMDVQFKGFDPGAERVALPTVSDLTNLMSGGENQPDSDRPKNRLLLLSGYVGTESLARGENSLFAGLALEALKGKGDAAGYRDGYEADGVVTTDELVRYLAKELPNEARRLGTTDKEKEAQPIPIGGATSHFPVTLNPAETVQVKGRGDALAKLAKAGTVTEELAKEGAALLSRMPKLKAQQDLRKLYQKVADGQMPVPAFTTARTELKESLTLPRSDADAFARKVTDAIDQVTGVYIKETNPGDLTAAAVRGMYQRVEEALPADLEAALRDAKTLAHARRTELLRTARTGLGRREDLDGDKDADLAILAVVSSLNDPNSIYYNREAVRTRDTAGKGRFPGVGVSIRPEAGRGGLLVVTPIKGSPAFQAGVRAGDLITKIVRSVDNGGNPLPAGAPTEFSTKGMKTEEAIGIITGKVGSPIRLVVDRNGKELTFDLKRNWVSVEAVMGVKRDADAEWSFTLDAANKIGYVRLTQFTQSSADDLKAAVADLKERGGLNGLILDLRGNSGGLISSAVSICELFVGTEKLVSVRPRAGSGINPDEHRGRRAGDKSFDLVVLINGQSAGASEIVAACLQDHERATILGERTFGLGSAQNVYPVPSTGGEIKLTTSRYYPPSDRNLDKLATRGNPEDEWGVRPDRGFEIKLVRDEAADLVEHMREVEVILPPGVVPKAVTPETDRQLTVALVHLRATIAARRKAAGQ